MIAGFQLVHAPFKLRHGRGRLAILDRAIGEMTLPVVSTESPAKAARIERLPEPGERRKRVGRGELHCR